MCGIAGIWPTRQDDENALRFVDHALEAMKTRGPDGAKRTFYKGAWLAHRRLAIQDLSEAASQPMYDPTKRYFIVFNGEIYNHREIRKSHLGHVNFRTTSDTETLLHLLIEEGLKTALSLLHGMFAFGFYDSIAQTFVLARDPFGEKPLFYHWNGVQLSFCSTLKPFRNSTGDPINPVSLLRYLRFGYVNGHQSILENVQKVKPGTYVCFTAAQANHAIVKSEFKYFSPRETDKNLRDVKLERRELISAIENSVREQLISDVPVGCFLSGGIDSSLIAAMMQRQSSSSINTFTIGFVEPEFNESHHAEEIARFIGSVHHTKFISAKELLDSVSEITRAYDEPFSDPSMLPTMQLCRFARENVAVCLSGDGADELFGGYPKYRYARLVPLLRKFGPFQGLFSCIESAELIPHHITNKAVAVLASADGQSLNAALMVVNSTPRAFLEELFPRDAGRMRGENHVEQSASYLRQMMLDDQEGYLPNDILVKVDRAAMAYSLETRAPFLSKNVFEKSQQLSDVQLLKNKINKRELREILYGFVPKELVDRPKKGFSVPIGAWMRGPLKEWGNELVFRHTPYLSKRRTIHEWQRLQRGDQSRAVSMWNLLMFIAWFHGSK
jgi:asparagine synthase (glutamine-hydrolysing)